MPQFSLHTPDRIRKEWIRLPTSPCNNAIALENKADNRYSDILAMEDTRVKLSSTKYINANHMQFEGCFQCIGTQAPMPNTFEHFWTMIIDHRVELIVMLTKFVESKKIKAHCYWPDAGEPAVFGNVTVAFLDEIRFEENSTMRKFKVCRDGESLIVTHIQYTGWPDFGTPKSSLEIRKILRFCLDFVGQSTAPPVIHCSAGIGRAGTFITLLYYFYSLEKAQNANGKLPTIFEIVSTLRKQRMNMVQTFEQYSFIYQTISDELAPPEAAPPKNPELHQTQVQLNNSNQSCRQSLHLSTSAPQRHRYIHNDQDNLCYKVYQ